jgi:pimeloyl-ACP methyl ester carboxylesterase
VVLVHAGGLDGRMWEPLAERLEDRFTLVIPDLPGHGRSPLPSEPFAFAEQVLALLDELDVQRAPFVAASFGGWVTMQLLTAAPGRVSALVLLAGTLDLGEWSDEMEAFRAEEDALLEAGDVEGAVALGLRTWVRDPAVADLVADMSRIAFEAVLAGDVEPLQLPAELGAVAVPTLAVSGGLDLPDFARIADHVAATVPGAQRAEVPDAGHLIALERPDATAALVGPFLSSFS